MSVSDRSVVEYRRHRARAMSMVGAAALVAGLGLVGCGSDSGDDVSAKGTGTTVAGDSPTTSEPATAGDELSVDALDGRTFVSTKAEGAKLAPDGELRLNFENEIMAAKGGCNVITGFYEVTGAKLAWTETPAATMMACEDPLMAQDTWVTETLTTWLDATLEGQTLTLSGDGVSITLEEEIDTSLTGVKWTLNSLISGDAASSLPAGVDAPTLEIAEDGTVTLFAGCNNGGGSAVIKDFENLGVIEFQPMRLTMMACEGEASTVETAVTTVLDGSVEANIAGKSLTITKGTEGLVFQAP